MYAASTSFCQTITLDGLFSSGNDYVSSNSQISWTLGDIQTTTYRKGFILTQGSLQSGIEIISAVQSPEYKDIELKVFPNPVREILNINFSSGNKVDLKFELFNIEGEKIITGDLNNFMNVAQIQFNQFQNGCYILKIFSTDNKFSRTFKILYNN
jgi:hypothetical protein